MKETKRASENKLLSALFLFESYTFYIIILDTELSVSALRHHACRRTFSNVYIFSHTRKRIFSRVKLNNAK